MNVIAVLMALALAQPLEVPLTYTKFPCDNTVYSPAGSSFLEVTALAPADKSVQLPELIGAEPLFYKVSVGQRPCPMVFDRQRPEDDFYTRLRFDANSDNDLRDDPVITATLREGRFAEFIVDFTVGAKGESRPYSIRISLIEHRPGLITRALQYFLDIPKYSVIVRGNCAYQGRLECAGHVYRIWLDDGDLTGSFDKPAVDPANAFPSRGIYSRLNDPEGTGDLIFVEPVHSSEELAKRPEMALAKPLGLPVPDQLGIGETLFDFAFDPRAMKITLTPVSGADARAKLNMPFAALVLGAVDPRRCIAWCEPPSVLNLKTGTYYVVSYVAFKEEWGVFCDHSRDSSYPHPPNVMLSAGQEILLPYGEPYRAHVTVDHVAKSIWGRPYAELQFSLVGGGNEYCEIINIGSDRQPEPPIVKVMKPGGEIVWQGAFRYG